MNFNLYLPDELGERARSEELKLSRLLREAVIRELQRRDLVQEALSETQVYEVEISHSMFGEPGNPDATYFGRITGKRVLEHGPYSVFVTSDKRVIVHEEDQYISSTLDAGATEGELVSFLHDAIHVTEAFVAACFALGVRPVVDL